MYLGIDLGTSGVKVVLMDEQFKVQSSQSVSLTCDHPHPLWSEQAPEQWWQATEQALDQLAKRVPLQAVKAIGVTGQMHGAVLVDSDGQPLRPAILWNDGRCASQCTLLNQRAPTIERITGNQVMTGMTAPKMLWIAEHEPDIFRQIAQVLLPKDYLRWKLSGCYATDMSDASGTLWLNVATRQWDETLLDACGLTLQQVPLLLEGPQVSGYLREEYQQRWGFSSAIPIVAGGGDYAAGAVGVGVWQSGQAMLSLGTSGVYFVVGFLTTIGLSAKNAILIVEFAKDEIELADKGLIEAALSAVRMRLRPILMTSMAFILGVLPLALGSGAGSGAQNAVGTGVIGGMIAATLLAIYSVPIFFVVIRRRFPGKPKEGEE